MAATFGEAPSLTDQVSSFLSGVPFLNDGALVTFAWIGMLTVLMTLFLAAYAFTVRDEPTEGLGNSRPEWAVIPRGDCTCGQGHVAPF